MQATTAGRMRGAGTGERRRRNDGRGRRSGPSVSGRRLSGLAAALLVCVLAAAVVVFGEPSPACAAAGDTYTKTTTITSGGKYLLEANISNEAYGTTHDPAATVLGSIYMNSLMAGVRDFALSGNVLTSTADLSPWEFTITSSGTTDGSNAGYWIKSGSSYLDVTQGLTGLYAAWGPETVGSNTVSWQEYVSQPFGCLSSTPRVWFWDGSDFYTKYTSDTTSIGNYASDPNWAGYYTLGDDTHSGWAYVSWYTPWGSYGTSGDSSQYGAKYTNTTFYLMGMRPGLDKAFPPDLVDQSTAMGQVKNYQYYFGDRVAVAASALDSTYESPGSWDLYASSFESKQLALYQKDVYYTGTTVTAKLNGGSYAAYGGTMRLYDGVHDYSATASEGTATFGSVAGGTYSVYAGGADTGVDLTVSANNAAATVDFYTLTFSATAAGLATSAQANAVYAGTSTAFTSGGSALKGKSFSVSASGSGADTYTYSWSGDATGTASSVSIGSIAAQTAVSCTVTGYRNVTISKVTDAAVTTQADDGGVIDLSALFSIDANAGAATYTIETGGTGTGTICDAAGTADAAGRYLKVASVGSFPIKVSTAAAGYYNAGSQTNTLTVANAPDITSAASSTFVEGGAGSFTVTATGTAPVTLTCSGTLPTGVTFTDNGDGTATIAGTPDEGTRGSYELTLTAANGVGSDAQQTFTLAVDAAPAITSTDAAGFTVGAAGSFTVTATGRPTPALTCSGTLPSGVTFTDNGDGTATIAGTPAAGTWGSYPLTITAANGVGSDAQQTLTLGVSSGLAPVTTVTGVPSGWAKSSVALTFGAVAGEGSAPVDYTEYRIGSGEWTRGTQVTVSRQGVTTVSYRSADTAGDLEATRQCTVRIDSVRPLVTDYGRPVCWQGGTARFTFRVDDAATSWVRAKLVVTRYGQVVRTYSLGRRATGKRVTAGITCSLPMGTYRWRVVAHDPAGTRAVGHSHYLLVYPGSRR